MTITLEINGINFEGFTSINVQKSMENISGKFSFQATFLSAPNNIIEGFPVKRRSKARVLVHGIPIINGYVEIIRINYNDNSHTISIEGRDRTCDVLDSQLDGNVEFKPPISIQDVIKSTLKSINITNIDVVNEAGKIEPFNQNELVSSRIGQTAFSFIETYSRKRQIFLSIDGDGNIVLIRASKQSLPTGLFNRINDPKNNNIKSASISFDDTGRFNLYRCKSQGNPVVLNSTGETETATIITRNGVVEDPEIRNTRILNFTAENSSDSVTTGERAKWEANIRRSRSFVYRVTVQGATYDGTNPWRVNRLVQVIDDFAGINAILLIKEVSFNLDLNSGTTTDLDLVFQDSYTPEPTQPKQQKKTNPVGVVYTLGGGQ